MMKGHWSKNLQVWLRNGSKLPGRKVNFWVFANYPTVHSVVVSRGRTHGFDM